MPTTTKFVSSIAALLLVAAACGGGSIDKIDITPAAGAGGTGTGGSSATGGTGGTGGASGGTGGATGGTTGGASTTGGVGGSLAGTGVSVMAGSSGGPPATGGVGGATGGTAGAGGTGGDIAMGGMAGTDVPMAGMGGMAGTGADPMGGNAGTGAEAGGGGTAGQGEVTAYSPRTGSFKVFAYSKTTGYRHTDAIDTGKTMLTAMGMKQGFEVTFSENAADFNAQNLAQYEVVFGLDPTGNNLSDAGKVAFEEWMTTKNGAFAGVHSSTDFENGWAFYSEVTGQYYDLHDQTLTTQNIQWDPAATDFIAVVGLPSPWSRLEEWYKFNRAAEWSAKPGFKILSRVTTMGLTRPVSYIREWGNFRSFYTSLGHQGVTYTDATFIRHVAAGLMWAARREALFKP